MTTTSAYNGPQYDPTSTAAALATKYTAGQQDILTARTKQASASSTALSSLKSAISAYQASLTALTSGKTMLSQSAILSDPALGSASARATATAGSYSFFVERLATAHQVAYSGLADSKAEGGTLGISLNGVPGITVNLATADADANGTLTPRELAAAINAAPTNTALVSASIVTIGATQQLVLTSKHTGASGKITLDTGDVTNTDLKSALSTSTNIKELVAAQDAVVWLGAQTTGTKIQQASNTFTNVADVTMTFTKAQASGADPVTLTVSTDNSATTANVQNFVDAYNRLKGVLDRLTDAGDPSKGVAAGVFASDGGINVLNGRMISMVRQSIGGVSLANYGVIAARDGTLTLDSTRLHKTLALKPNGLDQLIGSNAAGASKGLAGNLDSYLKKWSDATDGQLKLRQDAVTKLQTSLETRQGVLDKQYDSAYQRYLMQFTKLQTLQSQMASNTSMFDALFGDKAK